MEALAAENTFEIKDRIVAYWSKRSESFADQRKRELNSALDERWVTEIKKYLPKGQKLRVLDVGCGAGFFSILLSHMGHVVTGIDLTPSMIEESKKLAASMDVAADFYVMDAEKPDFPAETFDLIITRNLTWTLPHPEAAYREWTKLLKTGGRILNFDADYGREPAADISSLPKYHAHHTLGLTMLEECNAIKAELHISNCIRPLWDMQCLINLGYDDIQVDTGVFRRIYVDKDEFYNPTPIFTICAVKQW